VKRSKVSFVGYLKFLPSILKSQPTADVLIADVSVSAIDLSRNCLRPELLEQLPLFRPGHFPKTIK